MTKTPYAKGFETLSDEKVIPSLDIKGQFPSWLEGSLIRTGPAKFEAGKNKLNHWFDGHAMLHRFAFKNREVSYTNRFLHSKSYTEAQKKNKLTRSQFGTDPCYGIFGRFMSFFSEKRTDNCNVNVMKFGTNVIAMTETPTTLKFNPETLITKGEVEDSKKIDGHMTTAHPHFDFLSGHLLNYMLKFGIKSKYQFYSQLPGEKERNLIGSIATEKPSYVHSFAVTDNYIALALFPLVVFPLKLKFKMKPVIENYKWEPDKKLRFVIMDKKSGEIVRDAQTDPFFGFHHINAYEENGNIIADIVVNDNADIIKKLYLNKLRDMEQQDSAGQFRRLVVPLSTEQPIKHYLITSTDIELPRINYKKVNGKPYRYAYGCSTFARGNFLDSLVKVDIKTGEALRWMKYNMYPGEPVFVSRPEASDEDDGVLLSVVLDAERNVSFLLVLDAKDLSELAVAYLPHHIPFSFHGDFLKT